MTPKCPNHAAPMQHSGTPRIYICPVSDARFECDDESQANKTEQKIDKFGNKMTEWDIKQLDEE